MALLIFLFAFNCWSAPKSEGYPISAVNIVFDKEIIVKNDFCFPVVVLVNGEDFQLEANSKTTIKGDRWTSWSWMPGRINGLINKKEVFHPLVKKPQVSFGPEEVETHKKENSYGYDFSIPAGTSVRAMEEGKVIRVIEHYKVPHQDMQRLNETNTIEVMHKDGTVARYSHLSPASAKVKLCQSVKVGQELALSGNVGFSKGPHLHVDIFRPVDGQYYRTIPLKFK